jgi:hypothetical protein
MHPGAAVAEVTDEANANLRDRDRQGVVSRGDAIRRLDPTIEENRVVGVGDLIRRDAVDTRRSGRKILCLIVATRPLSCVTVCVTSASSA